MSNLQTMLNSTDGRVKAIAGFVLVNMIPSPPEAAAMLLAIANGSGPIKQRIDALSYLNRLSNHPKDQAEVAGVLA
jgi:hypothetical protein